MTSGATSNTEIRHIQLDAAGRALIPMTMRQRLGLAVGDPVVLEATDEGVLLRPLKAVIRDVQAYFADVAPPGVLVSEELIRERREEAARDGDD